MQVYTEPSLNNRIREKAIRNESLDRNTEKNVKRSAVFREAELHSAKFRVSAFSSSTTQDGRKTEDKKKLTVRVFSAL